MILVCLPVKTLLNYELDVHSSRSDKTVSRRGGGGGAFGYNRSKQQHKSKVYKQVGKKFTR